jgi:hypothetical protein
LISVPSVGFAPVPVSMPDPMNPWLSRKP